MRDIQKRYSLRKYRGIGLASVAIATLFLALSGQGVAADVHTGTGGPQETTVLALPLPPKSDEFEEQTVPKEEEGIAAELGREATRTVHQVTEQEASEPVLDGGTVPETGTSTAEEPAIRVRAATGAFASGETGAGEESSERLTEVTAELKDRHGEGVTYADLTTEEQGRYQAAIYNEYANHLVKTIFPNLTLAKVYRDVPTAEATPLFTQYAREERAKRGNPTGTDPKNLEALEAARQRVIETYNQTLFREPTVDAHAKQAPEQAKLLIDTVLTDQSLNQVSQSSRQLFAGLYLLHSQYQFEEDLASKIVSQDPEVTDEAVRPRGNAFQNLVSVGAYVANQNLIRNKNDLGNLLGRNKELFTSQIRPLIGLAAQKDLVERLARAKGQSSSDYFLRQTEATVQLSDLVDPEAIVPWLADETRLLVPLLSQGKGALVGVTRDSVVVGLNAAYRQPGELPNLESSHEAGQPQTPVAGVVSILNELENFNSFLRDASRYGQDTSPDKAKPMVVNDSLIVGQLANRQDSRVWQTKANNDTVRNLLAPLGMDSPSHRISSLIEGEQRTETSFAALNIKLLSQDRRGIGLYSHEMTHANDERLLFDGSYQGTRLTPAVRANRRQGQGPEVYARGLFEARDNTQTPTSIVRPVFNLNTSYTIANGRADQSVDQIQPSEALNSVDKLANYQHKLIKLLMWMEAKEAEVALQLPASDRQLYFNQVEQVARTKADDDKTSTNDQFVRAKAVPNSLADLVEGSYVTAGFAIDGSNRLGLVPTNGYNFLPLLDSFYGANYSQTGNTVGDLSFKRNAHEILGWYGYEAMVDYISGRSASDRDFLNLLSQRQAAKASTLEGKVEASPQATKIRQYEELLKLDLNAVPESIKAIYTPETLTRAIQADLAVLKSGANEQVIYNNLTNVRKLKQTLLSELIETTDVMTSDPSKQVLGEKTYDVIYVSNSGRGDGEEPDRPMGDLKAALAKVREGGRIVLVGDMTERTAVSIDKAVTIEAQTPDTALLLNQDLTITKPATIKGLTLQLNKESQATGLIRVTADVTLDGVSTKISDRQESQRPTLVLEGDRPVQVRVLNNRDTKLDSIRVASPATIELDAGVTVRGALEATTAQPVLVTSRSNFVSQFSGEGLSVTLEGANLGQAVLTRIKDLTLTKGTRVGLADEAPSQVIGLLNLAEGTQLNASNQSLSVTTLDGTGTLTFNEEATFRAENSQAATKIEVVHRTRAYTDGKTYVTIPHRQVEPSVTLIQRGQALQADQAGRFTYMAPYEVYHFFESAHDGRFLPESVEALLEHYKDNAGETANQRLTQPPGQPALPSPNRLADGEGYWEFDRWETTILGDSQKIYEYRGFWRYVPKPAATYTATYQFATADGTSQTLPAALTARLLGKNQTGLEDGSQVDVTGIDTTTYTDTVNKGTWTFQGWDPYSSTISGQDVTVVGRWSFEAKPWTVSYAFVFEGEAEAQFDRTAVALPAPHQVTDLSQLALPKPYTSLVTSRNQAGEWQFQGWGRPTETGADQAVKVEGRWLYKAYEAIPAGRSYQANPEAAVGTTNQVVTEGRDGKRSAFTQQEVLPPVDRVEKVGTKPTVERVPTPASILYEADDSLEVGSANVLKQAGQAGVSVKTTTYRVENGKAVPNEPTLVTESGQPTIYKVGTKPVVDTRHETLTTVYKADDQVAVGQPNRIETVGQPAVITTTTTYRIENGQALANTPTVSRIEGVAQVELVGTKPTVERVETATHILYEADDSLEVGSANVLKQAGQSGVSIKTITYRIENGTAVPNEPTLVTESGQPTIYKVGTKPTVVTEKTDLPVVYKSYDQLDVGQPNRVDTVGQPSVETTTTTYRIENGQALANTPIVKRNEGVAQVELVGTKPVVDTRHETLPTVYKADDQVAVGQPNRIETVGQPAVITTTTTYRIEDGKAVANTPTVSRIEGVAQVEFVGTKPTVERVETATHILYEADDNLEVGSANVLKQAGQAGVSVKTTTYRVENGKAVPNEPTLVTESGQPTIYKVGTKPTVVTEKIDLPVVYKSDDQLEVGQPNRVETVGQPMVVTTTTTYRIENGQALANTPIVKRNEGVAQVEFVGTKPVVDTRHETLPTVYKADDQVAVGQPNRIEAVGQPTVITTTTTYRIEDGKAVANTPTVSRIEGVAQVEFVGTKPTVERVETATPILYEADDSLEVGSANVLKQAGQAGVSVKTTTYRVENGTAVPNEPTLVTESGQPTIYKVGTKPTVVTEKTDLPVVYKSDDQLEVGQPNRVETVGQPMVVTTTTTYRIENGQALANTPTVSRIEGVAQVELVGTKPTVERVETATQILYEADDSLEVGSANVLKQAGQAGVSIKTITYRIENGKAVPNEPTLVTESGQPTIYKVGTKPTVVTEKTDLPVVYKSDDQLDVGQPNRVDTVGQPSVETTTTTYRLENGQALANTPTVSRIEGVAQVEFVGTKPTVERVETATQILYEADDSLEVGSANVLKQAGQAGVSVKTTTYRVENGTAVPNEPTLVTESGQPTIYKVGTKPTVVTEKTDLPVVYKSDDQLEVGQPNRVETVGQPMVVTTTTTYRIENGQALANTPTVSRIEGVAQVELVGTKPTVERVETATQILFEADDSLEVGSANVLKQAGQAGVSITTITYRIENGTAVPNEPTLVTESGQPTIYKIGTKPTVVTEKTDLPVVYKSDDQLDVGQPNRVDTVGQPSVVTTTTTYRLENGQALANTPTVSRIEGVAQVELVGTKPTVERVETATQILYEADDSLEVGSANVLKQAGQAGVSVKTITYRIENGKTVPNEPTLVTESGQPTIYKIGTKPTVVTEKTALPIVYKSDDQLDVGQPNRVATVGQPAVVTTTTTYRIENGQALANTPIVKRIEGVAQVEFVGTKPVVDTRHETLPTVYKADDQVAVGQPNRIETVGQPAVITTTTTYRIEDGKAVANTPTVSRIEGVAQVEFVGTKPMVVTEEVMLPIIYEEEPSLVSGSLFIKRPGLPTVTITTVTYRLENGKVVANPPQVTTILGQSEIQLVGIKQEQNGGSDTVEPLPTFDPSADSDGDGFSNGDELTAGSDPKDANSQPPKNLGMGLTTPPLPFFDPASDSDEDGFSNGDELTAGSDPKDANSQPPKNLGMGLTTPPLPFFDPAADSDEDGFSNGDELTAGSDPKDANSQPPKNLGMGLTTPPLPFFDPAADSDGDGFSNGDELTAGSNPKDDNSPSHHPSQPMLAAQNKSELQPNQTIPVLPTTKKQSHLPETGDTFPLIGLGLLCLSAGIVGLSGRQDKEVGTTC